ncbi:MAG: GNAT family N-acetyltransferase [Ignavibacteriaceae bacterium]
MKVFIVTEGFQSTGYGHLTRCLSLYQAFEERGIQPKLIAICDESGRNYLGEINIEVYNWLEDRNKFLEQINGSEITIVDSYLACKDIYDDVSRSVTKGVYLDDCLRIDYPNGIIVNGTIGAENLLYERNPNQKYLLGIDYIPLRKEFWDIPSFKRNEKVQDVLITFGGQDIRNLTFTILDSLLENFSSYNYHVVLGSHNIIENLDKYSGYKVNFYISLNAKQMFELMLKCDLAITAAGQTTYELARVGIQTIGIGVAENQKYNIKGWIENGFFKKEIWYHQEDLLAQVTHSVKEIIKKSHNIKTTYCDGQGARRVIKRIIDNRINLMTNIILREATFNDAEIIFDLSNDDEVRTNSINKNLIEWKSHQKWLKLRLSDKNYKILLFFIENNLLGQVKFEIDSPTAIISISLHRDYRGKGLSSIVLKKAIEYFLGENDAIDSIVALIRPENHSSIKSFLNAGFIFNRNEIVKEELFLKFIFNINTYVNKQT